MWRRNVTEHYNKVNTFPIFCNLMTIKIWQNRRNIICYFWSAFNNSLRSATTPENFDYINVWTFKWFFLLLHLTFFKISFSPTVAAYTYMNYVTISFPWYDVIRVLFEPCSVPIMIVVWQKVRINKNVISRSHSKAMSADHYIPEIVIFGTDEHNWNKCKNIVLIKVDWYSEHV